MTTSTATTRTASAHLRHPVRRPGEPPERCRVCVDDRQHVGWDGQHWTTHDELAAELHVRIEDDDGLLGVGIAEPFAIPQRALIVPRPRRRR